MRLSFLQSWAALVATASAVVSFRGHDLSSLKLMEDTQGATFKSSTGQASAAEAILGAGGMNAVRLRTWVNPSDDSYDLSYTLELAARFSKQNYSIYLDFHFSDTWTDPSHQSIPSNWPTNINDLSMTLRNYVSSTLQSFQSAGIDLAIVSLGNEVSAGMLWPLGQVKNNDFSGFATLYAAARAGIADAVSAGISQPRVMIHLNNGWDEAMQTWWYKSLLATGTVAADDFDVMGVSFYPFYDTSATLDNLQASLTALANTYDKPVIVAETDWPTACAGVALSDTSIPVSTAGQTEWVDGILQVLEGVPGGQGLGMFYWEPAFINNAKLGSSCSDAGLLFSVEWEGSKAVATALSSVDMYK